MSDNNFYSRAISMSGNLSSPWIVNSRLDLSNNKYAEILSTTPENLKQSMLALDYDTLRQVKSIFHLVC